VHGLSLKSGAQDCRTCHASDLTGSGTAPSCDSCHQSGTGWRTDCTFCHGGTDNMTGAPPRGLMNQLAREAQTFSPHTEHVSVRNHRAYDCTQCHIKPVDVLSMGHVFDDSPGQTEVTFAQGLSVGGTYDGQGTCANLYCHGNGRGPNGTMQHQAARPTCTTCHAGIASGRAGWRTMSGGHEDHLRRSFIRARAC